MINVYTFHMESSLGLGLFAGSIFLFMSYRRINDLKICKTQEKRETERIREKEKNKLNPLLNEHVLFDLLFLPAKSALVNRNISPELYQYDNTSQNQESKEEHIWKQRILLQNTPNGNIAMFYDLYRQAFAYHSDSHISYSILNKCAMKYVRVFYCRDFFIDTTVLPVDFVSPFNKMKEDEEMRQKMKASEKRKELKLNFDSSAFVNKRTKTVTYQDDDDKKNMNNKEVYKNNFRYIGKISGDLNILQKMPPPPTPREQEPKTIDDDYDLINNNKKNNNKKTYSLWKNVMNSC